MFGFRKMQIPQLYFRAMWVLALFLYILIPLKSGLLSLIYMGIVALSFGCFILLSAVSTTSRNGIWNNKSMIYFVLLILTIVISFILGTDAVSFDVQIMGILGFIEMPLAIVLIDRVRYDKDNTRFLLAVNIMMAVVFTGLSFSKYAYSGKLDCLYLGYSNPNETAMFLLLNQAILIIFLPEIRKLYLKLFVVGLCMYEEYLIILTESRTCVLVSILIIIYFFFGTKMKLPKWMIPFVMIIPAVFLLIYPAMYSRGLYADMKILGKEIYSGREVYFISQLERLSNYWIVGDVRNRHFTNMHNSVLAIMASCGVVGYVFWFLFYYNRIQKCYRSVRTSIQYIAWIVISGLYLHSCSEAALFVGGAHYSIIVATFFWILKGNSYDKQS